MSKVKVEMDDVFDYERNEEDDFYNILGCSEHSTIEQIQTEYKSRVLDHHPDKNPDDPQAAQRFARLSKAKDILTDPEKRKAYDVWKNSGIEVPFEKWQALRESTKTTLHWASVKPQPTIQPQEHQTNTDKPSCSDQTDTSPFGVSEPILYAAVYDISESGDTETGKPQCGDPENQITLCKIDSIKKGKLMDKKFQWERDPPSDILKRFRNYEI